MTHFSNHRDSVRATVQLHNDSDDSDNGSDKFAKIEIETDEEEIVSENEENSEESNEGDETDETNTKDDNGCEEDVSDKYKGKSNPETQTSVYVNEKEQKVVTSKQTATTLKEATISLKTKDPPQVKLTLTNLKVVGTWKYKSENQECMLCHKDLMLPVQEPDSTKINGDVTIGTCKHGFHAVCINSWLIKKNISCPHCSTNWTSASNVGSSVYVYKSTA